MNTGGLADTNAYLFVDEVARKAAIIDAPRDTLPPLIEIAQRDGWRVEHLLLTHGHWDHIGDHAVLTAAFPEARVWISRGEETRLRQPGSNLFELPYQIPPRQADAYLEDRAVIAVGGLALEALATPGHAAGHMCLYCAGERVLFAGDLLMAGSVGRYDFADGDLELLKASLRRILALPDETTVLSGHGPATTIGRKRTVIPSFAAGVCSRRGSRGGVYVWRQGGAAVNWPVAGSNAGRAALVRGAKLTHPPVDGEPRKRERSGFLRLRE